MNVDGRAIKQAQRNSALKIIGSSGGPNVVAELARDAQSHADWLAAAAKEVIPAGPIACRAGCQYCCHLRVLTTIPEAFQIFERLRAVHDEAGLKSIRDRIERHRAVMAALPVVARRRKGRMSAAR